MKTLLNNNTKFAAVLFTAFVLFAFLGNAAAQQKDFANASPKKKALMIGNLKSGLNSDNEGLRRSAIYFTGFYQIEDLVEDLEQVLTSGKEPKDKIVILLALYKIGGEESYRIIQDYVMSGNYYEARKLAKSIVNEIAAGNTDALSVGR